MNVFSIALVPLYTREKSRRFRESRSSLIWGSVSQAGGVPAPKCLRMKLTLTRASSSAGTWHQGMQGKSRAGVTYSGPGSPT